MTEKLPLAPSAPGTELAAPGTELAVAGASASPAVPSSPSGGAAGLPVVRRGNRQQRFLGQSVLLEETGIPGSVRLVVSVIGVMVSAFIGWAAITSIEESAAAPGEVVPVGQVQVVQHLEGGIISEILVKEGSSVEAGQPLVRLQPALALAELEQMRAREAGLIVRAERLRAFAEERKPDFNSVSDPHYAHLVKDQESIFQMQENARVTRLRVLADQVEQRQSEIAVLNEQLKTSTKVAGLFEEERSMRGTLVEKGLQSKTTYLNVQRQASQAYGDTAKLRGERQKAMEAIAEAQSRIAELTATLRMDAMAEMGTVTSDLAQVRETLLKLQDRVKRLEITAPVAGIVKGLMAHTVGGVVAPGATVLEIVPENEELVAEIRILTRDIGHVRTGLPVTIKFTSYDYARYGSVSGTLSRISATTFTNAKDPPFYKGVVTLSQAFVGDARENNRILPGMAVDASINTGQKTLLQYLLKPIYSSLHQAFHER